MAMIKEEDIRKIAKLAHLEITDEEVALYTPQMADIVGYVEQLNELATDSVEPATGGLTPEGEATETKRRDVIEGSLGQQLALDQAPTPSHGHFRVPKVL
ncbi:MAG: Asp-tRNA(Asn)/Glu-tRNA(Gln) amidotransferase subunit GatC [Pyrinomonadaceae bacterium]|nr:Asp-tRNA(Asn)/Glu-tRNA(Gln) amidotransferase subunit GatC [Pyrinomonadaceae bacterium]